jgi:hypothetical protein
MKNDGTMMMLCTSYKIDDFGLVIIESDITRRSEDDDGHKTIAGNNTLPKKSKEERKNNRE